MSDLDIGALARLAVDMREDKRKLESEAKEIGARLDEIKQLLYAKLDEQGIDRIAVDGITISKSDQDVPTVKDWDAVNQWITEHEALYMYQKRISAAAYKELLAEGVEVPGVETYVKRDINIRKA